MCGRCFFFSPTGQPTLHHLRRLLQVRILAPIFSHSLTIDTGMHSKKKNRLTTAFTVIPYYDHFVFLNNACSYNLLEGNICYNKLIRLIQSFNPHCCIVLSYAKLTGCSLYPHYPCKSLKILIKLSARRQMMMIFFFFTPV